MYLRQTVAPATWYNDFIARGIPGEQIRHYAFAFEGKKVLIG